MASRASSHEGINRHKIRRTLDHWQETIMSQTPKELAPKDRDELRLEYDRRSKETHRKSTPSVSLKEQQQANMLPQAAGESCNDTATAAPKLRLVPLYTWLGGPYAIMLQLAHPGIASASCAHSRFVTQGISRLRRTVVYIMCLVFGTEKEQGLISGMINKQHFFIRGTHCPKVVTAVDNHDKTSNHGEGDMKEKGKEEEGGGTQSSFYYDARDPELQKWVAATLFKGMILTNETFRCSTTDSGLFTMCRYLGIKPPPVVMSGAEKEVLLQECASLATSLDMPPHMWFSSLEEFEEYFENMLSRGLFSRHKEAGHLSGEQDGLGLAETSKKMGHVFLYEMQLPFWLGLWVLPMMRLVVRAWLPGRLREEFGLEGLGLGQVHDTAGPGHGPGGKETGMKPPQMGYVWIMIMGWTYIVFVWSVWLVDWLMPAWMEAWIVGLMVEDMRFAAREIERTGRWPM